MNKYVIITCLTTPLFHNPAYQMLVALVSVYQKSFKLFCKIRSVMFINWIWITIYGLRCRSHHNIKCGVIYRHPHNDLNWSIYDVSKSSLTVAINSKERQYCLKMGDFNLNHLNYESHGGTDDFINSMGPYFFHPQILQPKCLAWCRM